MEEQDPSKVKVGGSNPSTDTIINGKVDMEIGSKEWEEFLVRAKESNRLTEEWKCKVEEVMEQKRQFDKFCGYTTGQGKQESRTWVSVTSSRPAPSRADYN